MITQEIVREFLDYDPETGKLTWIARERQWFKSDRDYKIWNTRYADKEAFTNNRNGYFSGAIFGKMYDSHRVIWFWLFGKWPDEIDHINHDRGDNRKCNLREVSLRENRKNQSKNKKNTSGYLGVSWYKPLSKWSAKIQVNRRMIHLGYFESLEAAVTARKMAEKKYEFHENHGSSIPLDCLASAR